MKSAQNPQQRPMRRSILPLLLFFLILGAYGNHFHNAFHFDDKHTIVDNPSIRDLGNIHSFFTDGNTFSVLPANRSYRPIVATSLAIDYWLGHGYQPFWFHLSTFIWFILQLAAMYALYILILNRVRPDAGNRIIALLATAWYGLHPVNAETVNYIIQRGDIYSTLGVVLGLVLYASFPVWRGKGIYLLPVAVGALAKPPALFFPVFLFLYIYFFEEYDDDRRLRQTLSRCLPAAGASLLLGVLNKVMTPKTFVANFFPGLTYQMSQPYVWWRYFKSFFFPVHLSADTDLKPMPAWSPELFGGVVFTGLILWLAWYTAKNPMLRPVSFGLFWFIAALLPTSLYTLAEVENDHRMYFPFVGLVLAVCWAIALAVRKYARQPWLQRLAFAACIPLLCAYAYGTWQRNAVWQSEETLWLDVTLKSPKNGRGLMNYGLEQMAAGKYPIALDYMSRAEKYTPTYGALAINLGVVNGALDHEEEAQRQFRRAMALAPQDSEAYYFYGRWLSETGRTAEALDMLQTASRLDPSRQEPKTLEATLTSDSTAAVYLVNVSLKQYEEKRYPASILSAREALKRNPNSAAAYNNVSAGYIGLGLWDLAIENAQQALRVNPQLEIARNNLATAQEEKKKAKQLTTPEEFLNLSLTDYRAKLYTESLAAARNALQLRPNYPEAYNNIAAAYMKMNQWDEAIAAAQEAIRLKPDFQLARNNLAYSVDQKQRLKH